MQSQKGKTLRRRRAGHGVPKGMEIGSRRKVVKFRLMSMRDFYAKQQTRADQMCTKSERQDTGKGTSRTQASNEVVTGVCTK